jgi:signal transduction histidine kinase
LASLVSHDLRNPLATVLMQTALLRRSLAQGKLNPDRLGDSLERIERNGLKMDRLIDELLDIAQLQAGEPLQLAYDDVDLAPLVKQAVLDHQRTAPNHRLELDVHGSLLGHWDAGRLERVIDNLLSNAIKYSPQGGRVLVEVAAEGASGPVTLRVSDQGVGIAAVDLPQIFAWFGRGKNVGGIRGSGIGLVGVKAIVDQHGGSISVQSEEGKGTTFTVRLPRQGAIERDAERTRFAAATDM